MSRTSTRETPTLPSGCGYTPYFVIASTNHASFWKKLLGLRIVYGMPLALIAVSMATFEAKCGICGGFSASCTDR